MKTQHSLFVLTAILVSCSTYLLGRSQSIKDEIEKMKATPKKEFVNIMNNAPIPQEARIEKNDRLTEKQEEILKEIYEKQNAPAAYISGGKHGWSPMSESDYWYAELSGDLHL